MPDSTFEALLARQLRELAQDGVRPFDRHAIAEGTIAGARRTGVSAWLARAGASGLRIAPRTALTWLAALLLTGTLLAIGARLLLDRPAHLPPPFGPAANGLVAYSKDGDILVGDPESGDSHPILSGPETDTRPLYSLDGTQVISLREVPGGIDLVRTNADGGDPLTLNDEPFVDPAFGAWAPSGRTFAIASTVAGAPRLWFVDTDGGGAHLVAEDLAIDSFAFRPPDGAEILVRGTTAEGVGLYAIDVNTLGRRTIVGPDGTTPKYWDLAASTYSPDGTRVAYQRHDPVAGVTRLHIVDADGRNGRVLHQPGETFEGWPVWSPDGTRLIIITSFARFDLWNDDRGWNVPYTIIRADGTGPVIQTGPPLPKAGADVQWSPDGTVILMAPNFGDGRHLLLDPRGGPATRLPWAADTGLSWQRRWSP